MPAPPNTPQRFIQPCTAHLQGCEGTIDIRAPHHGERVTGFMVTRAQGGANQVTLPEHSGEWVCRWCLERLKRPVFNPDQGSLL